MEPTFVVLEPEKVNHLVRWWSQPEAGTLIECLEKAHMAALVKVAHMQSKSIADRDNDGFKAALIDLAKEADKFETTMGVLKSFFPDGPFIARIEL